MENNIQFGVFYQVYRNKNATQWVLENFRQHFPNNPVILISDGGEDFTDISQKYDCKFYMKENIFGNETNNYDVHAYDSHRTLEWWNRQKLVCDETKQDYVMIMEDDVYVKDFFSINSPFHLKGVRTGGALTGKMREEIGELGFETSIYGMCGGSIYNANTFLKIYEDVVDDIQNNMDRLMGDDPDLQYRLLGAVDANITYHFNKRGYKYEEAEWLAEVREPNHMMYPIIHQWKQNY